MQEIIIGWDEESKELVASDDVTLNDANGRDLRVRFSSLPDEADGAQIDWEGYCPFSRVASGALGVDGAVDLRFTFCDWIGLPGQPHGRFKFSVRVFDVLGNTLADLDPGGEEEPPPPNNNWP